ncbi:MAG: hypothetical protein LBH90_09305 [Tannerella sp.]|jgi:hypothetical protein|nr:hypothetical protein [Tannerella sp.]
MKRFVKKLSLFGLLFGCILLFIFLLIKLYLSDPAHSGFFMKQEMLVRKYQQKIPAVVLLGGSNVMMGFNSGVLHDSLGISVINAGFSASLGLQFMLRHTSTYLTKGDILVIAPEYNHFYNDYAYGGSSLAELFYINPDIITDLDDIRQFKAIIGNTNDILMHFIFPPAPRIYKIDFNKYGDLTSHWNMPPQSYDQVSYLYGFKTINTGFLDYYENAVADLRSRGVQVIIIPPPLPETSYRKIEDRLIPLFSEFDKRNLSFSIPPQESAYSDSLFFDSPYHLVYEGLMIRTGQLLELLKGRL